MSSFSSSAHFSPLPRCDSKDCCESSFPDLTLISEVKDVGCSLPMPGWTAGQVSKPWLGQNMLYSAMSGFRPARSAPNLPGGFTERPNGVLQVAGRSSSEAGHLETLRDFARMVHGGSVLVLSRHRLYPLRPQEAGGTGGLGTEADVSAAACQTSLAMLEQAIAAEFQAQGQGLSPEGRVLTGRSISHGSWRDMYAADQSPQSQSQSPQSSLGDGVPVMRARADGSPSAIPQPSCDARALRSLASTVASQISVGPGVAVVAVRGLPPVLWQPTFVLTIGAGQVRVLTFAFVGEPVTGDRPGCKKTPFSLRMVTDNLIITASEALGSPDVAPLTVHYSACHVPAGVNTSLDLVVNLEEELFAAVADGDWWRICVGGLGTKMPARLYTRRPAVMPGLGLSLDGSPSLPLPASTSFWGRRKDATKAGAGADRMSYPSYP